MTAAGTENAANLIEANAVAGSAIEAIKAVFTDGVQEGELLDLWSHVGLPILKVVLLIFAVLLVAGWARRLTIGACKKVKAEVTLAKFLGNLARWTIMLLGGLTILQTFGIEVTSFAAVLAAMGFAVGMALSGTLGNVAAGVLLLVFRPFKVGDYVKASGVEGVIDEIGLFTTTLDTPDNRRIIVPNGSIFGSNIENITHHPTRRCDVSVGVDYNADITQTRQVLLEAAAAVPQGLKDPAPQVILLELGGSSVDWQARIWVPTDEFWPARDALTEAVKRGLDAAKLPIPFPQLDVHIDGGIRKDAG